MRGLLKIGLPLVLLAFALVIAVPRLAPTDLHPGFADASGTTTDDADPTVQVTTAAVSPRAVTTAPVRPPGVVEGLPNSLSASGPSARVPILVYHHVDDRPPAGMGAQAKLLTVSSSEFEAQAGYLTAHAIDTLDFRQLYLVLAGAAPLAGRSVILTFDDGGADLYTYAFPILKRYGLTATFFVVTKSIGRPGYLTWEQLREMQRAGMSIESHTRSHPDLTGLNDEALALELSESMKEIEDHAGRCPVVLSYPGGHFDTRVKAAARDAGYLMAVSSDVGTQETPGGCFSLPRIPVYPGFSTERFAAAIR